MNIYAHHGHKDFILCLGYKGEMIKDYFLKYGHIIRDFTFNLQSGQKTFHTENGSLPDWNITFADTGINNNTGSRVKQIEKYIQEDNFLVTYGDGVANVDINKIVEFHKQHNKIATVTSILPPPRWSNLRLDPENKVIGFDKNVKLKDIWIDGGFFAFKKEMFDYLTKEESCMLEREPMGVLSEKGELHAYKHHDFWQCMDTPKDVETLNTIWESGKAPWKIW